MFENEAQKQKWCSAYVVVGNDCNAAMIAKKKSWTQEVLKGKADDIPHWPRTYLYSAKTQPIRGEEDIQHVTQKYGVLR